MLRLPALFLLGSLPSLTLAEELAAPQGDGTEISLSDSAGIEKPKNPLLYGEDGWLDLSGFIAKPRGFLAIPIIVTEPAVGYGGGLAAVFMRPRTELGDKGFKRPNITAIGGMITANGTQAYFAGDSSYWLDGKLQSQVAALYGSVNLDFYGLGNQLEFEGDPVRYNLDAIGGVIGGKWLFQEELYQIGLRYLYGEVEASGVRNSDRDRLLDLGPLEYTLSSLALSFIRDSRDSPFTPTKGTYWETTFNVFDDAIGASSDYQLIDQIWIAYIPLAERWFLGIRGDLQFSFGDPPFFMRPSISMRGIPAQRYQGEHAASAEVELRWQFYKRLSLLAFGGYGTAWTDFERFRRNQNAGAVGTGFRYELARKFGLHAGIDVAAGPEEWGIYIQFGSAWMRP